MNKKNILFFSCTILVSLCLLLSTSITFFIIAYIIFFLTSLYYFKNIRKALYISAVFSIPTYYGRSFFPAGEGKFLFLRPFSAFVLFLTILSINKTKYQFKFFPNIFIILFYLWGFISFIYLNPDFEKLGGLYQISIAILFYFLTQIYSRENKIIKFIIYIIYSFVIVQSLFCIAQFVLGHPLYFNIEEGIRLYPYGRLASEDAMLFRPSGTFSEPTDLARFLTILLPIILLDSYSIFTKIRKLKVLIIFLTTFAIFVSLTRFSWFFTLLIYIYVIKRNWKYIKNRWISYVLNNKIFIILIFIFIFLLFPLFARRLTSSSISFEEGGSFNYRITLAKEAVNLIELNPLFGVGLRNFVNSALEQNITGFYNQYLTEVHNVPLLIASEMGIPALIFFLCFVFLSFYLFFQKRATVHDVKKKNFFDSAAICAAIYILESSVGTLFWGIHIILFFLFMGIII